MVDWAAVVPEVAQDRSLAGMAVARVAGLVELLAAEEVATRAGQAAKPVRASYELSRGPPNLPGERWS